MKRAVLVGDRGMITAKRMKEVEEAGFDFMTALPHIAIEGLIKDRRRVIKVKDLEIQQLSELDAKQRTILDHLGVTLRLPKMVKH